MMSSSIDKLTVDNAAVQMSLLLSDVMQLGCWNCSGHLALPYVCFVPAPVLIASSTAVLDLN